MNHFTPGISWETFPFLVHKYLWVELLRHMVWRCCQNLYESGCTNLYPYNNKCELATPLGIWNFKWQQITLPNVKYLVWTLTSQSSDISENRSVTEVLPREWWGTPQRQILVKSSFSPWPAIWPKEIHLISLNLNFIIWDMEKAMMLLF